MIQLDKPQFPILKHVCVQSIYQGIYFFALWKYQIHKYDLCDLI